ncbi:MAG: hypothetical protein WC767_00290 [Candidatus Paceibacterota bacterium]|jgi:hypothetical protein
MNKKKLLLYLIIPFILLPCGIADFFAGSRLENECPALLLIYSLLIALFRRMGRIL